MWSRAELLDCAWRASEWQFAPGFGSDRFAELLADWELWPVEIAGELAGVLTVKGPEMHCCILPQFFRRWATPGLYRRVLKHKIRHGRLRTSIRIDHQAGREFVERFGFQLIGNCGDVLLYEMR